MIFSRESLNEWRRRYLNPHHRSYQPSSLSDAWTDCRLWFKEIILWITGLSHDPAVLTEESAALKTLSQYVPLAADLDKPLLSWINHSSFWISYKGADFITDPIWNTRCTPVSGFGPKRKHPVPYDLSALPTLDYVLISHNHYDHLDGPTINKLHRFQPDLTYFVPQGCGEWFRKRGIVNIQEMNWWQSVILDRGDFKIRVTSVPAQHFSGRGLFDINKSLWCGWVVEFFEEKWRTKSFYFCGDTGYNPVDFKYIGKKYGPFDLSLIPIGAYLPRKIMSNIHVNPYEALLIHKDVRSKLSVGCHYHTFALAQEHMSQPPYDLLQAMEEQQMAKDHFLLVDSGHIINW